VDLYIWVVIAHVSFVIVTFMAHGVSAFASFRIKQSSDRSELRTLLELSGASLISAGVGLLIAVALGIWAAMMGGHFGRAWPWVSIGVVVVITVLMTPLAANPMRAMRVALGMGKDKSGAPLVAASDDELAAAQSKLQPLATAVVGIAGIGVLVWLMEGKPF
jgi:hypothetical protein